MTLRIKKSRLCNIILFITILSLILFLIYPINSGEQNNINYKCKDCNVILIVVDALRADHLGSYGYPRNTTPFLDSFAEENIRFEYAFAAAPSTVKSVASMFTSFYPTAHKVGGPSKNGTLIQISEDFVTLAELMKDNGYNTGLVSVNMNFDTYTSLRKGFDKSVVKKYTKNTSGNMVNEAAVDMLNQEFTAKPFFLYLHYMDPHEPYFPPEDHNLFNQTEEMFVNQGYPYIYNNLDLLNAYDGEIHFVDSKIKNMINHLEEKQLLENSIIIITADHGEHFREHGPWNGHGHTVFNVETKVPLIIKLNNLSFESDNIVSLIDLYPTLIDILDIEIEHDIQGRSFAQFDQKSDNAAFSEWGEKVLHKSIVTKGGYKLIIDYGKGVNFIWGSTMDKSEEVSRYMYDMSDDPLEFFEFEDPQRLSSLNKRFYEIYDQTKKYAKIKKHSESDKVIDEDIIEELEALGYMN